MDERVLFRRGKDEDENKRKRMRSEATERFQSTFSHFLTCLLRKGTPVAITDV